MKSNLKKSLPVLGRDDETGAEGMDVSRRGFLSLSGAMAAATATGCARRSEENILPFSKAPEHIIPGQPLHFATVHRFAGDAEGLLVTSNDGRPTKIEGDPEHPVSRGSTSLASQASIMNLYDPDRAVAPTKKGAAVGWDEVDQAVAERLKLHASDQGMGLRVLMPFSNSLTEIRLREKLLQQFPKAKVFNWEPTASANTWAGTKLAFGDRVDVHHDYTEAEVVLSVGADFLGRGLTTKSAREFAARRRMKDASSETNRLYVVESALTLTGTQADHRLRIAPSVVPQYLAALAGALATEGVEALSGYRAQPAPEGIAITWFREVAKDLLRAGAGALVVCGESHAPAAHALVHAINHALGNVGKTVAYSSLVDSGAGDPVKDIVTLAGEMRSGRVKTLLMLGCNPVYDAPSSENFADAISKVEASFSLSSHRDETAQSALWHLPQSHYLESWSDARARGGSWSIAQPLIAPLHKSRSAIEVLAAFAGTETTDAKTLVEQTFAAVVGKPDQWTRALHTGIGLDKHFPPLSVALRSADIAQQVELLLKDAKVPAHDSLDVEFVPCPKMHDGRYANNPWLLELPDAITKISWDNAAMMSPATARALGVSDGDMIRLAQAGKKSSADVAVWTVPGHADHAITATLGWGRRAAGRYGTGQGFDVNPVRTTSMMWVASGVTATRIGRRHFIARTQDHETVPTHENKHGDKVERPIVLRNTVDGYKEKPDFAQFKAVEQGENPMWKPLWEEVEYTGHKWGMSIDLSTCTGCNACVVACQSENNIPNVGKRQIARGREMYWMRIDRYYYGDEDDLEVAVQPIACQHCEEAPCENVCPVNATTHTPEGLNDMAYNRCIGTRYCMNNCPYKVRRFNFLSWHGRLGDPATQDPKGVAFGPDYGDMPETEKMAFNPEVTVRMRGVMEKCTYCVQRIQSAKIGARREGRRRLRDGEVTPACAQACPSQAIVFGDLNDPSSRVATARERDRAYRLLAEVGTQPRTSFLAQIRNPNPAMRGRQA